MMIMVENLQPNDWVVAHYYTRTCYGRVIAVTPGEKIGRPAHTMIELDLQEHFDDPLAGYRIYMNGTPLKTEKSEEALIDISRQQLQVLAGTI